MSSPSNILENLNVIEDRESDNEDSVDDNDEEGSIGSAGMNSDNDDTDDDNDDDTDDDNLDISSAQNMHGDLLQTNIGMDGEEYDDDDDDDDDDDYLQKFDDQLHENIIQEYHPELIIHSNDDIQTYTRIVKNITGQIIDPLHTTLPFVTKYERARVLGERAKQLNAGAKALVEVESDVIDGYLIATEEFKQRKIPFIVKRPMPNGGCEYWKLKDLEII